MRIIHCADIHLDSCMDSNLPIRQARQRSAELCGTFSRMVEFAKKQQVEAVLIAGDLFDTDRVSRRTIGFVLDTIRSAPEVDFFYLRGNHDEQVPLFDGYVLPENLKTFTSQWTGYRYGQVVITGIEPDGAGWETMYEELNLSQADTNLVVLHGQDSTQPGEELICVPKLRNKHITYLALGHLHSYRKQPLDETGEFCYCGCLEGRGFDECGEKGFVLLDIADGVVHAEFVPFALRQCREIPVDITGLVTVSQLQQAMQDRAREVSPESLVKFVLRGSFTTQTQKDLEFLRRILEERFYFVKIKDESRFFIDPMSYEHDVSLKGEFIRLVMASDRTEEEKARMICCGISALSSEEVVL